MVTYLFIFYADKENIINIKDSIASTKVKV